MMPRSIERDNATKPAGCSHDALQHPVKLSLRTAESEECPLSTMRSAFESKSKATSVGILAIQGRPCALAREQCTMVRPGNRRRSGCCIEGCRSRTHEAKEQIQQGACTELTTRSKAAGIDRYRHLYPLR